jgi:DUF4097 and DUF4098 domain-containing protein YvlB
MSEEAVERLFRTPTPARLKLSNVSGSVKITGHHADTIHVKAQKRPNSGDLERTEIELKQDQDGKVIVTTRFPRDWRFFPGPQKPCDIDYLVEVPFVCELEVSGVSNPSEIENVSGAIRLNTVSGPITSKALSGRIKIDTVSAKVQVEDMSGPLQVKSVSGEVFLRNSTIDSANISTVSGNLNLQTSLSRGPYHFETISGDLTLEIAPPTGCLVKFQTLSGRFKTDLTIDKETINPGKREFSLQGGGPEIHYQSISGNLKLFHSHGSTNVTGSGRSLATSSSPGMDELPSQETRDYT